LKPEDLTVTEDKVSAKIEKVTCGKPETLLVGIVVDVSGSRRSDSHLLSHYDDLEVFLNKLLTREDGTYLVAYGDEVRKLSEVVTAPHGISTAFDKLKAQQPIGSTALYDAIKAAASANFKGRAGRRILVVIGDWEDNSSHIRSDEALKAAQRASTTIYAILDSDNGIEGKKSHKRAVQAATELTEQTGGLVYEVREKHDFEKVLQAMGTAVTGSCRVEYTTTENAKAKKGVKLQVEATSKDVSILYPKVRFGPSQ
jgi:VWFA-related protein